MSKISVLVPVYDVEPWLCECLDSILSQSFNDIEVICVDDASHDNSLQILRRYAEADSRVRIIINNENLGLMMTRRRGYEAATGEYLLFCDSDDILPANALKVLYGAAMGSGASVVTGDLSLFSLKKLKGKRLRDKVGTGGESYLKAILSGTTCSLCGTLFHRSLFDSEDYETLIHCNHSEDRILLSQLLVRRNPSVHYVPFTTYLYRINESSISRRRMSDFALCAQLSSIYLSYGYVNAHVNDAKLLRSNNGFFVRTLGYYMECGYDVGLISGFNSDTARMTHFVELVRILGIRLGLHTYMCMKSEAYRAIAHSCRCVIRRFQGKD
jgi:glycosyltransferase involved in cell wall biosynthesis